MEQLTTILLMFYLLFQNHSLNQLSNLLVFFMKLILEEISDSMLKIKKVMMMTIVEVVKMIMDVKRIYISQQDMDMITLLLKIIPIYLERFFELPHQKHQLDTPFLLLIQKFLPLELPV